MASTELFTLHEYPLDIAALEARLKNPRAGAFASFEGWVRERNENRRVVALEYEAYAQLCLAEGTLVVQEALGRFAILDARCAHRVGRLSIGEVAVWVGVAAEHRNDAFLACRHIIDEVKQRIPIWKKEHYSDGATEWIGHGEPPAHVLGAEENVR